MRPDTTATARRTTARSFAVLLAVTLAAAGCSSSTKKVATTTTVATIAPPATASPGSVDVVVSAPAASVDVPFSAPAASVDVPVTVPTASVDVPAGDVVGTGGSGIDACGQTAPDSVAGTFVSSIQFAGPDTYLQCFMGTAVTGDQIAEIEAKAFSIVQEVPDATAGTYTFTATDGTKAVVAVGKAANGKYYVTGVTFA